MTHAVNPAHSEKSNEGSDWTPKPAEPRFLAIGRITRPHGVRGELNVEVLTDFPERFTDLESVYIGDSTAADIHQVGAMRWNKDRVLLTLKDCRDRNAAELLRNKLVLIPTEEAMPLADNEYYAHELVGLDVVTVDGENLGRITNLLFTNANDVYVVMGPRGEILLPAIADVVQDIDLDKGVMTVRLLEGLLE